MEKIPHFSIGFSSIPGGAGFQPSQGTTTAMQVVQDLQAPKHPQQHHSDGPGAWGNNKRRGWVDWYYGMTVKHGEG